MGAGGSVGGTAADLFGEKLLSKEGEIATVDALAGKTGVLIYFSAHWCPPCRGFTPKLAEFHTKHAEAKGFQTIFVSGDHDKQAFEEYYGEMPWLAVPFEAEEVKSALNKKYGVQGIPALVVLGADGELMTKDGRSKVMANFETCEGFPWKPRSLQELLGSKFIKQDGTEVDESAIENKTLGLYFSAHWCPPCQQFTPKLKKFYDEYKSSNPDFEMIFVSSDNSEEGMLDYFKQHGDYLALPYAMRSEKEEISSTFEIRGIPSIVIVGPDRKVLNKNARGKIDKGAAAVLAEGWELSPVMDIEDGVEFLNSTRTIVANLESCDEATAAAVTEAMMPVAKKYIVSAKNADAPREYAFVTTKGGGIHNRIKEMTKDGLGSFSLGDTMEGKPMIMLLDCEDNGAFYFSKDTVASTEGIEKLIASKEAGELTRLQLSG